MENLTKLFVSPTDQIRNVISVIDKGAAQVALVVNSTTLIGIVTDGDIRRGILKGKDLDTQIHEIMQKNFKYLLEPATNEDALSMMKREGLSQVPLLNDKGNVINIFLLEKLLFMKKDFTNPVIILAGGRGERLMPLTKALPKPMLEINGKPLLEIIINRCISSGFRTFYISVYYLKQHIKDYFGDGSKWGIAIEYLEETRPLGTAGPLSLIDAGFRDPVLVINGDILTRVEYPQLLRYHYENMSAVTMCISNYKSQVPFGVVKVKENNFIEIQEKPVISHYINAGIYVMDPNVINLIPKNSFFDMPQLLEKVVENTSGIKVFPLHEYWLDVGLPETFARANGEWE
jgi:dTDP-glucose pyrophosphorylase